MSSMPDSLPRTPLLLVQRAARQLRAGKGVRLDSPGDRLVVLAAETVTEGRGGELLGGLPGSVSLALSGQRLASLTGEAPAPVLPAFVIALPPGTDRATIAGIVDATAPLDAVGRRLIAEAEPASALVAAAIELAKLAGLLPAALCLEDDAAGAVADAATVVPVAAVRTFRRMEAADLRPVSEAAVPLVDSEQTRIVAFRAGDGAVDQYAIVIGDPTARSAPLVRLHSECFTGDLLGSLRCDCGDQLRGAVRRMAAEGAGVLLYLAQEGRGIGLTNKLRAYALQDDGLDTVDANTHLGFEPDERDYWTAATMLRHLGVERVRLLTNNPAKIEQLSAYGVEVVSRLAHVFEPNPHNRGYLLTKALKAGHMIDGEKLEPKRLGNGSFGRA